MAIKCLGLALLLPLLNGCYHTTSLFLFLICDICQFTATEKSTMTESDLRKPFIAALRNCGAKVIPYVGSKMGEAGTADVFVAHIHWHGWVEFKGPTTKVQPLQQLFINEMNKRGVNALVIRLLDKNKFQIQDQKYIWSAGWEIINALQRTTLRDQPV